MERQNRTVRDSLVKVLNENAEEWSYVIDGVLFAHRVSRHYSTKYPPFYPLYNHHPTLPIDVKYNEDLLVRQNENHSKEFDEDTFKEVLSASLSIMTLLKQILGEATM